MMPVPEYRKKLMKLLGFVSPILMLEYARARKEWKRTTACEEVPSVPVTEISKEPTDSILYDLEEQKRVLERMKKSNTCKCNIVQQEKWIAGLEEKAEDIEQ